MSDRVVVFIDYQNVYRGARDAFHDHRLDPHWYGQIDPILVGNLLTGMGKGDRELRQVRVYRGLPVNKRDQRGYAAARRQIATWRRNEAVDVSTRPLRYPDGWPANVKPGEKPREKGIDVALAVDLAVMAARKECEVAIVFSADTDIAPALEYACEQKRAWGKPKVEVAAWRAEGKHNPRLNVSGGSVWCHWIDENSYKSVRDLTDYTIGR
jgi:uncharacterized LabA/DUF88 family protein